MHTHRPTQTHHVQTSSDWYLLSYLNKQQSNGADHDAYLIPTLDIIGVMFLVLLVTRHCKSLQPLPMCPFYIFLKAYPYLSTGLVVNGQDVLYWLTHFAEGKGYALYHCTKPVSGKNTKKAKHKNGHRFSSQLQVCFDTVFSTLFMYTEQHHYSSDMATHGTTMTTKRQT